MSSQENKRIFADNLKFQMDQAGISRNKLAKDLNIKYSTLSDWLNANTYPRIDKVELLSEYFEVPKYYLIERSSVEEPTSKEEHYQPIKQLAYFLGMSEVPPKKTIDNKFTRFLSSFFESDESNEADMAMTHPDEYVLLENFWSLNEEGKEEAKRQMKDLTQKD
ncbi:MAG: helix-turn-helix domain-containing protein, partial [Enterococcus sp.]